MRSYITILLCAFAYITLAQREFSKEVEVNKHDELILDFAIADEIKINTWNENKVKVEVSVSINDGEHDDLFELQLNTTNKTIRFKHDQKMFERKEYNKRNCWTSDIYYTVYLPKNMVLDIQTISGDIILTNISEKAYLKTISGDIDITVIGGLEFKAKTISGEVYSDLDIEYPDGTNGLKQIVGMNVRGLINGGGDRYHLETISGSIFLRKG